MGKRLPKKKGAVKRPKASSSAEKRRSASRSEAAKRGWEKRRAEAAHKEAVRKKRSEAAALGWQKRRNTEYLKEGLNPRSAEAYSELSAPRAQLLHDMRLAVLGPMAYSEESTGRHPGGLETLRAMLQNRDRRWETFIENALQRGFSTKQARTAFFSPSVKRMSKASTPWISP
jgi:hypothetical protein